MILQGRKSGRVYSPEEIELSRQKTDQLRAALDRVKQLPPEEQQKFWDGLADLFKKKQPTP